MIRSPALRCLAVMLAAAPAAAQDVDYNRDVRPILSDNCFVCHGPDAGHRKAKLRLDQRGSAVAPRDPSPAIVAGDPAASELVRRITAPDPDDRMPPQKSHKTLTPAQIATLREWIGEGAPYARHWSLIPPRRAPLPPLENADWCRGFVDHWILARLEREGLSPSPEADRVTLLRRLSFDLTGLPPTPREVAAFVADERADAFERQVDRLLASPHYGERMALYWLDLVRYADTVGYHGDQGHAISPYRDFVIAAFNDNMSFAQFTILQLAGDLLPAPTEKQRIATGYNRVLQTTHEGGAQAGEYLTIYAADRVRNLGMAWLGATIGCAQCHDHKYDPFRQVDFYSLAAFFADIDEVGDFKGSPNSDPTTRPPEIVVRTPAEQAEWAAITAQLEALDPTEPMDAAEGQRRAVSRRKELQRRRDRLGRRTMVTRAVAPRVVRVLPRGNWLDDSGPEVLPAVPPAIGTLDCGDRRATRLDLARWLVSDEQPLTARVFVNRLWYLFFGKGLSARLDDLGAQGEPPVHPELLDALAVEFRDSGWDVRHMVRLLVTSSAYRQSSRATAELQRRDPLNRWVARQSRWRLPAEMVRDNALAVSGLLVRTIGGDSIKPYQPAGLYRHLNFPKRKYVADRDQRQWRRGLYMHWQRQFLHPALAAFDAPSREEGCAERPISNTPQAALTLLNDPTFVEAARVLAARVLADCRDGRDDEAFDRLFALVLSRRASDGERRRLRALLERHRADYAGDLPAARELVSIGLAPRPPELDVAELAAWTSVCRVVLNLHETVTRR